MTMPGAGLTFVGLGERWDWRGESKARLMPKVPDVQVELVQHPWRKGTLQGKISNSIDPFLSF
jgi:hypothetical protein